jgi:hypothetical protein
VEGGGVSDDETVSFNARSTSPFTLDVLPAFTLNVYRPGL